jgi:glutamate-1-semialdehyde 2,1-aminomutase
VVASGEGRSDTVTVGSLLKQELIEAGVLMGPTFNLCLAHDDPGIIDETLAAWKQAAARVAEALASNDPAARLRGKPMRPVFQVRPAAKKTG